MPDYQQVTQFTCINKQGISVQRINIQRVNCKRDTLNGNKRNDLMMMIHYYRAKQNIFSVFVFR
jgi:hypothetical protein